MRATLVTFSVVALLVAATAPGCDADDSPPQPDESPDDAAHQQLDEDVVVHTGQFELTIDDVKRTVERLRLTAPGVEEGQLPDGQPDWMRQPHAQAGVLQGLVHAEIVRREARDRNIEVTGQDEIDRIATDDRLQRYLPLVDDNHEAHHERAEPLREELDEVGLDVDDVRHLGRQLAYEHKFQQHLAEEFPDDQLWAIYQEAEDVADVVIAGTRNTPSSAEIDRAESQYDAEIRAHFRENRDRYTTPSSATVTMLRLREGQQPDIAALQAAADRLEDREDPEQIAEELELELRTDVDVNRHQNPRAHQAEVGDTGVIADPRQQPYAWRLEEFTGGERRSLDRPLRRQIASQILREQEGVTPSNRQRADEAAELLSEPESSGPLDDGQIEQLVDTLEEHDFHEVVHTGAFSVRQDSRLPEIGLAEELFETIQNLEFDDPVSEPVLDRGVVYVARLVDRQEPTRQNFEQDREEFRDAFLERNEQRLVSDFVRRYHDDHDIEYRPEVVAEHFGRAERGEQPDSAAGADPADHPLQSPASSPNDQ